MTFTTFDNHRRAARRVGKCDTCESKRVCDLIENAADYQAFGVLGPSLFAAIAPFVHAARMEKLANAPAPRTIQ